MVSSVAGEGDRGLILASGDVSPARGHSYPAGSAPTSRGRGTVTVLGEKSMTSDRQVGCRLILSADSHTVISVRGVGD